MPARQALVLVAALLAAGCTTSPGPEAGDLPDHDDASDDALSVLASGLDTVWELAFADDGRVFFTERPGRVRMIDADGELQREPWARIDAAESGESGLMGLVLHPDFPDDRRVYLSYSYAAPAGVRNRIVSLTDEGTRGTNERVLVDAIPGASFHDGSRLAFGPGGKLYATTGDAGLPQNSQDPSSTAGKVLRIEPDGRVPADNPSPGSYVWTKGHRNPQGLVVHPDTGRLYATEHGPENHDEVNLLVRDANYGWPIVRGRDSTAGFTPSLWTSGPDGTIAPAGAAFVHAPGSALDRAFVFGTLKGTHLRLFQFASDGRTIEAEEVLFDDAFGRIRAVVWGPDGALYLGTSNKDGRGTPGAGDDRIVRVPLAVLEREAGVG